MQNTIYIDVLLVVNFVVNYFLLKASAKLISVHTTHKRGICAALVGAVSSLSIFLPYKGLVFMVLLKFIFAALMVVMAFGYTTFKSFAVKLLSLFTVSFFFSGLMFAVWMFTPISGIYYYNGVVYFNISSLNLFVFTVISYLLITAFDYFVKRRNIKNEKYLLTLNYMGKEIILKGFMDSGNHLTEPFSGYPVAVVHIDKIKEMLSRQQLLSIYKGDNRPHGMRIIPYTTVSEEDVMYAFKPDGCRLETESDSFEVSNIYIGLSKKMLKINDSDIILSPLICGEDSKIIKEEIFI